MGDQPSMPHADADASISRMGVLQIAAAMLLGVAAAFMVWRIAWVTEDCFITFRYVANTLAGHGAVFNVGEFTQGYTHPLWFALLLVGGSLLPDLILLSFGLGLFLTIATQFSMARSLTLVGGNALLGVFAAALFALVCVSSNSWLSFQTGGLENALSHLLLVILIGEIFLHELERPFAISVLGSLLVLNRPDFAFTILPFAVVLPPSRLVGRFMSLADWSVVRCCDSTRAKAAGNPRRQCGMNGGGSPQWRYDLVV